jgi:hypothetical protein
MSQRRVYLHVGAPKTGTTYVQDRLWANRASLREHGYHYPIGLREDHFLPALDLIDRPWGGLLPKSKGEWDKLVTRVRRTRGTSVISHEILAGASTPKVRRALGDLSFAEMHVVYSARDIARQVAAEWQEGLKHQRKLSFAAHLKQLQERDAHRSSRWFWKVQNLPGVLQRWGQGVPPERVHVVTVPQPGAPTGELWRRFCTAVGIDPAWAPEDSARRNPSIGTAESTLLRRINPKLKAAGLSSEDYRTLVRALVVHDTLAERRKKTAVTLPPDAFDWAESIADDWIGYLKTSGVHVVGDLEDLRPVRPASDTEWDDPDEPRHRDVAAAAIDALVAMTLEAARRPDPDLTPARKAAKLARRLRP